MSAPTACPDDVTFYRFLAGTLAAAALDPVAAHVAGCGPCAARVAALLGRDPLVAALRSSNTGRRVGPDLDLDPVLDRIRVALGVKSPLPVTMDATRKNPLADLDLGDFRLEPPAGPGELGRVGRFRLLSVLGRGGMGIV